MVIDICRSQRKKLGVVPSDVLFDELMMQLSLRYVILPKGP
jgi:hypothetical protein